MPTAPPLSLQLDLFLRDTPAYREAVMRYEALRPVLQGQHTLTQHSHATGIPYGRLGRDLRRFQRDGLLGLIDRRLLPQVRHQPPSIERLPQPIEQHIVRVALAHPFTYRELARIVQEGYHMAIDHRGIRRVLARHQLSPAVLAVHHSTTQQTLVARPATPSAS